MTKSLGRVVLGSALGVVCMCVSLVAEEIVDSVAEYSVIHLEGRLRCASKTPFDVEVECRPVQGTDTYESRDFLGTDGYAPRCVVSRMTMTLDKRSVDLPKRGWVDLSNVSLPTGVFVTSRQDSVTLNLEGGDGSGSYKVRFVIRGGKVVRREAETMDEEGELQVETMDLASR